MIELILFSALILLLVRQRFFWIARSRKLSSNNSPIIMAHRGITVKSPENTISSYKEAIEAGFNALELDILQTKDEELICSHNFDLERESNGVGWAQHTEYNKLKEIRTGVYTHAHNTQPIPRLENVLDTIPKNIFLNIEIKTHSVFDLSASKTFSKLFKKLVTIDGFLRVGSSHYQFLFTRWMIEILFFAELFGDKKTSLLLKDFVKKLII